MPDAVKTVGRYEIVREVGRGGMATVYLARQIDLDRFVALKELGTFHAADPSFAQRFVRESRVAGSLSHPNIVTVHEYFEHDGTPYIAMEFVEGGSLRPYVRRMTPTQISGVLEAVLAGLTNAEQLGIVHRDLKPENLMVTSDGRVKIADFGIAKATTSMNTGSFVTATGVTVGTPAYMAPEQAMAQDIGPWTDLYSVGCMAFEMFAGRVPFHDSDAPMAILLRHINEPIPPVKSIDPAVDQEVSDWIEALLVKDPAARTRSAAAAWDAYEEITERLLPRRWRREAPLTKRADEAPAAPEPSSPYTPPPPDLPAGPLPEPTEGQFDDAGYATFAMSEPAPPPTAPPPAEPEPSERTPPPLAPPPPPADPAPPAPTPTEPTPTESLPSEPGWPPVRPPDRTAPVARAPAPEGRSRRTLIGALIGGGLLIAAVVAAVLLLGGGPGDDGGGGDSGGTPQAIDVPDRPNAMGAIGDKVWVSTRAGTVGFTPPDEQLIERAREATRGGRTISGDADALWIPIPAEHRVAQIDASSGAPQDVAITTAGTPKAIAVSSGSVYLSQTDDSGTWVQRYDRATGGERGERIPVPEGTQRVAIRGVIWVLAQEPGPDQVIRYSGAGAELSRTEVGAGATALAYGDGAFWATGADDGSLTRIDERTRETKQYSVGGNPQNVRFGLGAAWITNPDRGALQRVDPRSGDVKDYPAGKRPFSLAITDTGVWVGDTGENVVRFVEP